jgi:hypothetical protein
LLDSFVQYQRWLAALSINDRENSIALSAITSNDLNTSLIVEPNDIALGATASPMMDEPFIRAATGLPATDEKSALELSGGSIADTGKVTLDADAGLELPLTPSWSFTAKFDGEVRPQPQLYAGSGTLHHTW